MDTVTKLDRSNRKKLFRDALQSVIFQMVTNSIPLS